jgi:hypothetical protein
MGILPDSIESNIIQKKTRMKRKYLEESRWIAFLRGFSRSKGFFVEKFKDKRIDGD